MNTDDDKTVTVFSFEKNDYKLNKLNNIRNYAGHINIREEVNLINFSDSLEKAIEIMNKLTLKDIKKYEKEYEAIE